MPSTLRVISRNSHRPFEASGGLLSQRLTRALTSCAECWPEISSVLDGLTGPGDGALASPDACSSGGLSSPGALMIASLDNVTRHRLINQSLTRTLAVAAIDNGLFVLASDPIAEG